MLCSRKNKAKLLVKYNFQRRRRTTGIPHYNEKLCFSCSFLCCLFVFTDLLYEKISLFLSNSAGTSTYSRPRTMSGVLRRTRIMHAVVNKYNSKTFRRRWKPAFLCAKSWEVTRIVQIVSIDFS